MNSLPLSKGVSSRQTQICPGFAISSRHKASADIKIRPIVSNINGPTQCTSWLLANALKPMLKNVPAHLENSLELIRCIQAGDLTTNKALPYPCSLDEVSLYTTIPIQEAITNATHMILNPVLHLSREHVSDLLQVMLNNMYSLTDHVFSPKRGPTHGFQHFRPFYGLT